MTPLDLVLTAGGPKLLLGVIALAGVLTLLAAALEVALERRGGPDPAAQPDRVAERGPALFVFAGIPALALAFMISVTLALVLGGNPERSGMPFVWPMILDISVLIAVLAIGVGSPLTQHWGLSIAAFGVGISAIFPMLFVINRLPFATDESIAYPGRFVFALTVGLIMVTLIIAAAALVSLAVASIRTARNLRPRRASAPPRLRLM